MHLTDRIEKLRAINEDMRRANEELIHELASKVTDTMISEWKIRTFYPLKNGKKVAFWRPRPTTIRVET